MSVILYKQQRTRANHERPPGRSRGVRDPRNMDGRGEGRGNPKRFGHRQDVIEREAWGT